MFKMLGLLCLTSIFASCSNSQPKYEKRLVGGNCDGCEAVFEYGDNTLSSVDTLPDFNEEGTKIKVEGTVFKKDGVTPAKDVIIYVYHTNQEGRYVPKKDAQGWGKKHGHIRSWLKTDENGHYEYFTLKPAPYPNRNEPAHIHYTILEPDGRYYWLSSCHFEGDSLLSKTETNPDSPRGGTNGLLKLNWEDNILVGKRDIILGKNIRGY